MSLLTREPETIAIIVPVYNEESVLGKFHTLLRETIDVLSYDFSITYVNDGSTDSTSEVLSNIHELDQRVRILELSRNFGHQAALTAGLDSTGCDVVITMDGDGQHPPNLIPKMIDLYRSGYDIVVTQRMDDHQHSSFKKWTSGFFYWLINRLGDTRIVPGAADFRLLSQEAVCGLKSMREYNRFLRGMVSWMGFETVIIPYIPTERLAGESKYSLKKMIRLARDAVFSFSLIPLQIGISLGFIFLFLAFLEAVYVLSFWVTGRESTLEPGWSSLMFMLLIVGGIIMLSLGFIGVYIGYIFQEVKNRPIYLIKKESPIHKQDFLVENSQETIRKK